MWDCEEIQNGTLLYNIATIQTQIDVNNLKDADDNKIHYNN